MSRASAARSGSMVVSCPVARGGRPDATGDMDDHTLPDPGTNYIASADSVLAAWAEPGVMERKVHMNFGDIPAPAAVSIHFLDIVVHGLSLIHI